MIDKEIFIDLYKRTVNDNQEDLQFMISAISVYSGLILGVLVSKNILTTDEAMNIAKEANEMIAKGIEKK